MNKYCYFCNENKHRISHNKAKASIIVIFLQLLTKVVQDTIRHNGVEIVPLDSML